MSGRKKLSISTIIIWMLILLLGIVIGCVASNWFFLKSKFFEVKLIEIIQWITSISIVILLAYFINERINNDFRKKELILELVSNFQQKILNIFTLGSEYINNPDLNKQNKIVHSFKVASGLLSLIINIKSEKLIKNTEQFHGLKWEFFCFKKSLTDTPFGSQDCSYTEEEIIAFQNAYDSLMNKLFHCKIDIYS